MATPESQSSLTTTTTTTTADDQFEGLEVMEFDPNTLWELLYAPPVEEGWSSEAAKEEMMVVTEAGDTNWWQLNEYEKGGLNRFDAVMEEACDEMGMWCDEEVNQVYEYEHGYSSAGGMAVCDEIEYVGLWQDN